MFQDLFPSESAGDGMIRRQYFKRNDGQGQGTGVQRVSCKNCGFTGCDTSRHDNSGGTLDGNGALGATSVQSGSASDSADGNQAHNKGGGCPLCGSKNYKTGHSQYDEFADKKDGENILI